MAGILILALTGVYLRFPFSYGGRTFMRNTHYVFMVIVTITLVWQLRYAFFTKTNADWREFAVGKKDLQSAGGVLAYYGYFSNNKPRVATYNVTQKMSYPPLLGMMLVQDLPCTLDFFGIKSMDLGDGHEGHGATPAVLPLREPAPVPVPVLEPVSATE